ncbi:MAG: GTP cyclohydrolase II [Rhodospirillum sp.]|nr:GTP cyclohydrolase II [Rhodospirillum sp.]MCF8492008.1 GTP cyclohydrolase II [Rhodospirillum sp.]
MTEDTDSPLSPPPSTAKPEAPSTQDVGVLARVDRGLAELRLGASVSIRGQNSHLLALAAESVSPSTLDDFARRASGPARVLLTGRRASVLGLTDAGPDPVAVTLAETPTPEMVIRLADPCLDLEGPLPAITEVTPLRRNSAAAAAVTLAKLARLLPAALVIDLDPAQDLTAMEPPTLSLWSRDILDYQTAAARSLRKVSEARVPLSGAENTRILAFRPSDGGTEHLAILVGTPDPDQPILARLHSECFTGDLLGSLRCDCGDQLRGAIDAIAAQGSGVLLYLAQEGRGIGLVNKLRAYQLQDQGFDTLDANGQLGFDDDERIYLPAAEMLRLLGLTKIRLLTNNPLKVEALARHGIEVVERVPHVYEPNPHNLRYLQTKAHKGGHLF